MNLHGYLARERVYYGSEEGIDFTNIYFYTVLFHALRASNQLAIETRADVRRLRGLDVRQRRVLRQVHRRASGCPQTDKVAELFAAACTSRRRTTGATLKASDPGARHLQPEPAGRAADRLDLATSTTRRRSIHPIASKIEIRKEGKLGRVYYPAPFMTNDNLEYYQDAYEIGYEKVIDTYAAATQHVDQGLSLTLFFKDTATTRDINKAQIYAWRKGIKTIYYIRLRQMALEGTEVEGCVSCMLVTRLASTAAPARRRRTRDTQR